MREDSYVLFPILRKEIISFFATAAAKSLQLCPTLCDPIDGSPPGPCPCNSPDKNTGVGCHFLLQCMKVKSESEVAQSCPTLSKPHGLQPTRLLRPWAFSGKSAGVGCHCLLFSVWESHYWPQFSSVAQSCPILCDPMDCSTPGLPVFHCLLELAQTHVHQVNDAIQPSHPLSSPSPPAPNPSQHQSFSMSQLFA